MEIVAVVAFGIEERGYSMKCIINLWGWGK